MKTRINQNCHGFDGSKHMEDCTQCKKEKAMRERSDVKRSMSEHTLIGGTKYTPGPWHVWPDNGTVVRNGSHQVCRCVETVDARLIAAAPELLAFIKMLIEGVENPKSMNKSEDELMAEAKAIIGKAEGK